MAAQTTQAAVGAKIPLTAEELRLVQVKLIAAMTKADGKVLEIEKLISESLIGVMDRDDVRQLQVMYEREIGKSATREEIADLVKLLERTTEAQRDVLLKIMSAIAMSDGEFHGKEQDLLMAIMQKLEMDG